MGNKSKDQAKAQAKQKAGVETDEANKLTEQNKAPDTATEGTGVGGDSNKADEKINETDPANIPATDPGTAVQKTDAEIQEQHEGRKGKNRGEFDADGKQKLKTREGGATFHQGLGTKSQQVIDVGNTRQPDESAK